MIVCSVSQSCPTLCDPMDCTPTRLLCPWNLPAKNTGVGYPFLFHGIFPTWGSNSCLLYCRWILYHWAIREAIHPKTRELHRVCSLEIERLDLPWRFHQSTGQCRGRNNCPSLRKQPTKTASGNSDWHSHSLGIVPVSSSQTGNYEPDS